MRTYWLSFCDNEKPQGQQFLGACIIEVEAIDAERAKALIDLQFPQHAPGAEWTAAATQKAHRQGCNPGGQVMSIDMTENLPSDRVEHWQAIPRNRLMDRDELQQRGLT